MKLWKKLTAAVLIGAAAVSAGLTGGIFGSAAAQQSTQKTPIVYDFVPDGESSSGSAVNIRAVQPGETVKVNLTVKNDPGTAGAKMIFGFDGLKLGRVARGQAYTGNFQWNGDGLTLVWNCRNGLNQKAADNAVIYSFTVTVPETAKTGDSFLMDLNRTRLDDISVRPQDGIHAAPDYQYEFHALKLVVPTPISSVTLSQTSFPYTGSAVKVGNYIKVKSGTTALKYGTDFTMTYADNINAGTASVTVTGVGAYSGTIRKTYQITPLPVDSITLSKTWFPYTGSAVKIGSYLTVKSGGTALKYGTDFTLSYENNVSCGIGTAKVTAVGTGNYTGSVFKKYTILPEKQAAPRLVTKDGKLRAVWTADANAEAYQVQYCQSADFSGDTLHSSTFASKTSYNFTVYPKVGETWYVRVRSCLKNSSGTYNGLWSDAASIKLGRIGSVTLSQTEYAYTGKAVKIGSYIKVMSGTSVLKYEKDFTLAYAENVNCGVKTASVTVTGIGEYSGSVTKYYSILPAQQAKPALSTLNGRLHAEWTADTNAEAYQVQYCQSADFSGDTLHSSTFASKTAYDFSAYPKAGETWYVRVRSYIKNSAGTKYGLWSDAASITLGKIDNVKLTQTEFAYTGNAVKVGSYIKVKSGTTALKYGTDFELIYKNNVNKGTASVTVKGIGEYAGSSVTKTYRIV